MKNFASILFIISFTVWGMNCLYIIFFMSNEDDFYLFGAFQTNKIVSVMAYAILSIFSFMFIKKNRTRKEGKN
ncbi:hypothetical protein SAMN00777080_2604 [Aquiflexum balticum DSM 16537]|uniref:DUF378 domain-containing protein n=1 Tax=Aquiflexum balticum DSM 16537 TaxID=758820 RepID=A0A1W2H4V9_9BACT|nr:hypothetical protein SAMN00777080_2604 [Aquiflexum balticum DSM 16537]